MLLMPNLQDCQIHHRISCESNGNRTHPYISDIIDRHMMIDTSFNYRTKTFNSVCMYSVTQWICKDWKLRVAIVAVQYLCPYVASVYSVVDTTTFRAMITVYVFHWSNEIESGCLGRKSLLEPEECHGVYTFVMFL